MAFLKTSFAAPMQSLFWSCVQQQSTDGIEYTFCLLATCIKCYMKGRLTKESDFIFYFSCRYLDMLPSRYWPNELRGEVGQQERAAYASLKHILRQYFHARRALNNEIAEMFETNWQFSSSFKDASHLSYSRGESPYIPAGGPSSATDEVPPLKPNQPLPSSNMMTTNTLDVIPSRGNIS